MVLVSDGCGPGFEAGTASLPLRLAVTGPMLAPTPSPIANVAAASRMRASKWRRDNNLGPENIILDIIESEGGNNPQSKNE
jgi:hypothetical protein